MPEPLRISADHARRFLVRRHLLDPPRSLPAKPESVLAVVERLGLIQFDPLEIPGARSHDLTLHARIGGYQREWCDHWLYGEPADRKLIEVYNKSLNILPIAELPHYAIDWQQSARHYRDTILREQACVADAIVERFRQDGPMSTSAFKEHNHAIDWWWAPTSAARAVMEALFVTGRLGIARRDGSRRYYDLIERLVPAELLARRESEEDAMRHRLLSRFRAVGLLGMVGTPAEIILGTGKAPERARRTAELVDQGFLRPVHVEGTRQPRYVLSEDEPMLRDAAQPGGAGQVTFLAPLDPLVWDRPLLRSVFGFDYVWEVYVPEARRKHGYYVLPILFGDRLVGRIEPRYDRRERTLRIVGISLEATVGPMDEPRFIPALAGALEAYREFIGAKTVSWPRSRPGRDIAAALRRVTQSAKSTISGA
jgi:uncharacterized protein YcaQ